MIIFLYGPDDYRREEKKRWYVEEFKKKYSGLSAGSFDLADSTLRPSLGQAASPLERLKIFLRGESLFEEKKLAVLENLYEAEEKTIIETLQSFVDKKSTIIVCSERKKPAKAFDVLLEKPSVVEKFEYLAGAEWAAFVRAEAKMIGVTFDAAAAQFLAEVYQGNSWGLVTELQKARSMGKEVGRKDLEALGLEVAPNYWAMMNGLKSFDMKNRLRALEKMFALGDPPPRIFNILASQWRFDSAHRGREKTAQMAEYDFKIKSGKLEYEEALVDLVL